MGDILEKKKIPYKSEHSNFLMFSSTMGIPKSVLKEDFNFLRRFKLGENLKFRGFVNTYERKIFKNNSNKYMIGKIIYLSSELMVLKMKNYTSAFTIYDEFIGDFVIVPMNHK